MNFVQIQDEIIGLRFTESQRNFVKNWINSRYQLIWHAEDWRFKCRVRGECAAVAGSTELQNLPAAFFSARELWYSQSGQSAGVKIHPLAPDQFSTIYEGSTQVGEPTHFVVGPSATTNEQEILVGPTPAGAYTFTLYYDRSLCFVRSGTVTAGVMSEDGDEPIWPEGHHHLLVPAAMSLGLKLEQDPGWADVQDEYLTELQQMREAMLPDQAGAGLQYRREV